MKFEEIVNYIHKTSLIKHVKNYCADVSTLETHCAAFKVFILEMLLHTQEKLTMFMYMTHVHVYADEHVYEFLTGLTDCTFLNTNSGLSHTQFGLSFLTILNPEYCKLITNIVDTNFGLSQTHFRFRFFTRLNIWIIPDCRILLNFFLIMIFDCTCSRLLRTKCGTAIIIVYWIFA